MDTIKIRAIDSLLKTLETHKISPHNITKSRKGLSSLVTAKSVNRWALSLFLTEEKAKARFKALKKEIGLKVYQIIGTHLTVGDLAEEHGVQSHVEKNGHFSLRIVEKIDYSEYFKLVDRL